MSVKTVYIGNHYPIAEYILFHKDYELTHIICETDRVTDNLLTFSLVRNIPIIRVDKTNKIENVIKTFDLDVIFIMCSYGKRVPIEKCGEHNVFNIHFSELPKYKGRHPSFWATYNNELNLGVTIHEVTSEFDRGKIITQIMLPYYIWETECEIFEKQTNQTPFLLDGLSNYLENGKVCRDNCSGSYYPPVELEDITINVSKDNPALIFNKVRSQAKANGAIIHLDNRSFRIFHFCFTEEKKEELFFEEQDCLYIYYKDGIYLKCDRYLEE